MKLPPFEFPDLTAAWQTDQPMHSQSANFRKFMLSSLNLAAFFSLNPVQSPTFALYETKQMKTLKIQ